MALHDSLAALIDKYQRLVALRLSREELERQGIMRLEGEAGRARHKETRALAHRFPAALRELDELDSNALQARLREVEEEIARGASAIGPARRWIVLMLDLHGSLRLGLAVKGWWLRQDAPHSAAAALLPALRQWLAGHPDLAHADVDDAMLLRYLRPPGGRLLKAVLADLAMRHGLGEDDLRRILFTHEMAK
jgi:hypothetical protein